MSALIGEAAIGEAAAYRAGDPACGIASVHVYPLGGLRGIASVHVYPLGGLRRSAKWSYAVADGRFTMKKDGTGFTVDVDLG